MYLNIIMLNEFKKLTINTFRNNECFAKQISDLFDLNQIFLNLICFFY